MSAVFRVDSHATQADTAVPVFRMMGDHRGTDMLFDVAKASKLGKLDAIKEAGVVPGVSASANIEEARMG